LAAAWIVQGHAPPTAQEMLALVDQRVREEILSREAVALGLDGGDEIIKRRLAQKMGFLAADLAVLQDPSDAELRSWYAQHADLFALLPRRTFRHLYFSLDRGPSARDAAAAALSKIAGKTVAPVEVVAAADPFMFRDYYGDQTPIQVAREFGPDFAGALFQLKPGAWQGPIPSGYGWHLVFVEAAEPSRIPAFEEIEPGIKKAWLDRKQAQIMEVAFTAMRARYAVVVPPLESVDFANLNIPQASIAASSLVPQ